MDIKKQEDVGITSQFYNENADVVYVKTKIRFMPSVKKTKYTEEVERVKETFLSCVERLVKANNDIDDRYLCGIDLSSANLSVGKWSRLRYDIYVRNGVENKKTENALRSIVRNVNRILCEALSTNGFVLKS